MLAFVLIYTQTFEYLTSPRGIFTRMSHQNPLNSSHKAAFF